MAHQLKRAILVATTVCGALPLQAQFHANEDSYRFGLLRHVPDDHSTTPTCRATKPAAISNGNACLMNCWRAIRPDYWNATMQGWVVDRPDIATPFMMVGGVEPADGTFLCMMFFLHADGRYMLDVLDGRHERGGDA